MYFSPCYIVVLDPHTPKKEGKPPIYDLPPRFFNFFQIFPKKSLVFGDFSLCLCTKCSNRSQKVQVFVKNRKLLI